MAQRRRIPTRHVTPVSPAEKTQIGDDDACVPARESGLTKTSSASARSRSKWKVRVIGDVHELLIEHQPSSANPRSGLAKGVQIGSLYGHCGGACFLEALLKSYAFQSFPRKYSASSVDQFKVTGHSTRTFHVKGPGKYVLLDSLRGFLPMKSVSFCKLARLERQGRSHTRWRVGSPARFGMTKYSTIWAELRRRAIVNPPRQRRSDDYEQVIAMDCRCYGWPECVQVPNDIYQTLQPKPDKNGEDDKVKVPPPTVPKHFLVKFRDRAVGPGLGFSEASRNKLVTSLGRALNAVPNSLIMVSVDDLRNADLEISKHLSWEQGMDDLLTAFGKADLGAMDFIRQAHFVAVVFDLDGVAVLEMGASSTAAEQRVVKDAALAFSVLGIEGDLRAEAPGDMLGHESTIFASLVGHLAANRIETIEIEDLMSPLEKGLCAGRFMHLRGLTEVPQSVECGTRGCEQMEVTAEEVLPRLVQPPLDADTRDRAKYFPIDLGMEIARNSDVDNVEIQNITAYSASANQGNAAHSKNLLRLSKIVRDDYQIAQRLACVKLDLCATPPPGGEWTLFDLWSKGNSDAINLPVNVLRRGVESAWNGTVKAPVCRIGRYVAIGREEQEAARETALLMRQYLSKKSVRPFNLAVFGSPGSGKSFLVKEIVQEVRPSGVETRTVAFNLSNYTNVKELHGAFHRIRDISLGGRIPVVFWDEFDASVDEQQFYWLRFFLAPMWDGHFQEGQDERPLGKCVFVFAGGRFEQYEKLRMHLEAGQHVGDDGALKSATKKFGISEEKVKALHASKGDDFERRLDAFIDLPNIDLPTGASNAANPGVALVQLRRAAILRGQAKALFKASVFVGNELQISDDHAKKLLATQNFIHGAGSLSSLVAISDIRGPGRLDLTVEPSKRLMRLFCRTDEDGGDEEGATSVPPTVRNQSPEAKAVVHDAAASTSSAGTGNCALDAESK